MDSNKYDYFCFNCNAQLNRQESFKLSKEGWLCKKCNCINIFEDEKEKISDPTFKKLVTAYWRKASPTLKKIGKAVLIIGGAVAAAVVLDAVSNDGKKSMPVPRHNFDDNSDEGIERNETRIRRELVPKFIGNIDITGSRLKPNEKHFLQVFQGEYYRFKDKEYVKNKSHKGWDHDGYYIRDTVIRHFFDKDEIGITIDISYRDEKGGDSETFKTGREIINYFREYGWLYIYDDVRDILNIL